MARCAYSAFCTGPDERTEKILFFRGRINHILLFFIISCRIGRFLSFFRIGKGSHKGPGDAVGESARALLVGWAHGAGNSVLVARSGRSNRGRTTTCPDGLIAAVQYRRFCVGLGDTLIAPMGAEERPHKR